MKDKESYWNEFGGDEKAADIFSSELSIRIRLGQLVKEEFVEVWLHTPNPRFNNQKPIDMIYKQDLKPLYEMLYRLESGTPT